MRFVSIAIGLVVGIALWYFAATEYAKAPKALAGLAAPVVFGRGYTVGGAENAIVYRPNGSIGATVFMRYVTANLITLFALFGASLSPLSRRNLGGLALAILCMIPMHAAAIVIVAKSILAPPGSLWGSAAQAYTVFGSHAIAFAIWWLLRPEGAVAPSRRPRKKR